MSAQPITSDVVHLNLPRRDDPRDVALVDLSRELATARSASKAVLAALKALEGNLRAERDKVSVLEDAAVELQSMFNEKVTELEGQRATTHRIFIELEETRAILADERNKPAWRRLLRR